jgi:hypothetical protein
VIFQIKNGKAIRFQSNSKWSLSELQFEKYLIAGSDEDSTVELLDEHAFGEPLLLLSNQMPTRQGKRADIVALDRSGNVVIVELKRDTGKLGVETQALQYLADLSAFQGKSLVSKFPERKEQIKSFLGGDVSLDDLNFKRRIILMARAFDPSIFSMGEWLANLGVAFRCIVYTPAEIGGTQLLTFSVVFDRSREPLYPLLFGSVARSPQFFWHNIGHKDFQNRGNEWWEYLVRTSQISASFENQPGDDGERLLRAYIPGDSIIAYASEHGAVGWGRVDSPRYELVKKDHDQFTGLKGRHLHRLFGIAWKEHAIRLRDSVPSKQIEEKFEIYHPFQTKSRIDDEKGKRLIDFLKEKFAKKD